MDMAKSLYLGGKVIKASDPRITYSSYEKLGLRCLFCGEPVFYKNGAYRRAHFSHFPDINPQTLTECQERHSSIYGNASPSSPWWHIAGGKGQRFVLFQLYFIKFIKLVLENLEDDLLEGDGIGFEEEFRVFLDKTLILLKHRGNILSRIIENDYSSRDPLEAQIVLEAIDYLTIPTSKDLFGLILYTIMVHVEQKEERVLSLDDKVDANKIYEHFIYCLFLVPWKDIFEAIWSRLETFVNDLEELD